MKHKVADLDAGALDAAVAKAEGWREQPVPATDPPRRPPFEHWWVKDGFGAFTTPRFSRSWEDGGEIIERERINLTWHGDRWRADIAPKCLPWGGPTPLIAAMRAYVASRFGDQVELP